MSGTLTGRWFAALLVGYLAVADWLFTTSGWGSLSAVAADCGAPAPDARFAPSPEETRAFIEGCRARGGVAAYQHLQLVDLVYPLLLAAVLASVLGWLTRPWPRARWIVALPVVAAAADYVENAGAWILISGATPTWTLYAVQLASLVKSVLTMVAVGAIVGFALRRHTRGRP